MDFALSQDTLLLCEGAREFLDGENGVERLRRTEHSSGFELWPQIAELGLLGVAAPAEFGGLGLGAPDAALIAEQAGYAALPEPLSETMGLVVPLLVRVGQQELARELIRGESKLAIASPLNPYVNRVDQLDHVLLVTPGRIALASAESCAGAENASVDPWRLLSRVSLSTSGDVLAKAQEAEEACNWANARGALLASAELCGLAARMLDMATEYAKTREQFGSAIGSFQAVKHLLANVRIRLEFARPVVYRAAACVDAEGSTVCDRAVSHAKVAATDAAILAAENAIQVFGGMGYTYEADLHLFMKRSWALSGTWGDREYHLNRLDAAVFAEDATIGPGTSYLN